MTATVGLGETKMGVPFFSICAIKATMAKRRAASTQVIAMTAPAQPGRSLLSSPPREGGVETTTTSLTGVAVTVTPTS